MQIEYDGTLLPCCNLRSDFDAHQSCVLGKLTPDSNIVDVWSGPAYVAWRNMLFSNLPKPPPCQTCWAAGNESSESNRTFIDNFRLEHGLDQA